jgi:hypothetical protein
LTTFCFVGFGTDRLRRQKAMKTAGKENPNRCAITWQPTELLGRKLEASLLNQAGWKARKHPAVAKYFFLTFPFIELIEYLKYLRGHWSVEALPSVLGRPQEPHWSPTPKRQPHLGQRMLAQQTTTNKK